MLKFEKNEIWENRINELFRIIRITPGANYPIAAEHLKRNYTLHFTEDGSEIQHMESNLDLIKYRGSQDDFPEYFL